MSSETQTRQPVETSGKMDNESGNQQSLLEDILQKVNLIPEVLDDIRSIKEDSKNVKASVKELEDSLQYTQTELADLQATCSAYEERLHILQEKDIDIQMLKYNEVKLLEKIEELEAYIRQENLVIEGVPENDREVNCAGTLIASLKECAEVTATTDDLCKLGVSTQNWSQNCQEIPAPNLVLL